MATEQSFISTSIKANKLSNTLFGNLITQEKMKDYCSLVLSHEVEYLNLDRGVQSIGVLPSDIHNYENLVAYDNTSNDGTESYPYHAVTARSMQLEMAIMLNKPSSLLFYNASFWSYPVDYLESLPVETIYVPNDEDLYRAENVYLNREVDVEVVEKADLDDGIIPNGVDMICINGVNLSSQFDHTLISKFFEKLPVGGVIFIDNNNDFLSYYLNKSDTKAENMSNPLYDLNIAINGLEDALVYHMPTSIGFTIIIKQ
jgi:hypothetical protein